jgi:hypothetical protein
MFRNTYFYAKQEDSWLEVCVADIMMIHSLPVTIRLFNIMMQLFLIMMYFSKEAEKLFPFHLKILEVLVALPFCCNSELTSTSIVVLMKAMFAASNAGSYAVTQC